MLLGLLAGFLVLPRPQLGVDGLLAWVPMLLYTVAAVSDMFDGYLARITHHSTALGEFLDMELDGLGTFLASVLAVQYGVLPWFFVLLGPARQFFLAGMWVRTRRGLPNHDLPHSDYRRVAAGLQMGFISAMLWPFMHPPGTVYAGYMAAAPIVASFSRDWLIVSGVLTPDAPRYQAVRARLLVLLTEWTPLLLRGASADRRLRPAPPPPGRPHGPHRLRLARRRRRPDHRGHFGERWGVLGLAGERRRVGAADGPAPGLPHRRAHSDQRADLGQPDHPGRLPLSDHLRRGAAGPVAAG